MFPGSALRLFQGDSVLFRQFTVRRGHKGLHQEAYERNKKTQRDLEQTAKARTSQTVWENGRDLLEVKDRLEHGQFREWCKANFPWGKTTIENMMNVAGKFPNFGNLDIPKSTLYLLAAPSTPESARDEALDMAEEGEAITHQQAQDLVEAHKKIADQRTFIISLEDEIKDLEGQI